MIHLNGIGSILPTRVLKNETLFKLSGLEPDWIVERTGIRARHLSPSRESTSSLAAVSAREALERSGLPAESIGLVALATSFPDTSLPVSTAGLLRDRLGLTHAVPVDISNPGIGFLLALRAAWQHIHMGVCEAALVVGAESYSSIADLRDRRACYLFGDGAGAFVVSTRPGFACLDEPRVFSLSDTRSGGGPPLPDLSYSLPLYRREGSLMAQRFTETLHELVSSDAEDGLDSIDHLIPQQIHPTSLFRSLEQLGLSEDRLHAPFLDKGNLLAASLPLAFHDLGRRRGLQKGHQVLLVGTDGRLLWGGGRLRILQSPAIMECAGRTKDPARPVKPRPEVQASSALEPTLRDELGKAESFGTSMSAVLLRVDPPSDLSPSLLDGLAREMKRVLGSHVRRRDLIFECGPGRFAIVLPNQDTDDARQLARRLAHLLETIDPAEEFELSTRHETATYLSGGSAEDFVNNFLTMATAESWPST